MDLALAFAAALRECLLAAEDADPDGGPGLLLSVADASWNRSVDDVLSPLLHADYLAAFRAFAPDLPLEPWQGRWWAQTAVSLAGVPSRLLRAVRTAQGAAVRDGAALLDAAHAALDDLSAQSPWRADRLAQTASTAASSAGQFDAALATAAQTGESYTKTWRTMHDPQVRHAHADLDGVTVPLALSFVTDGVPLRFPGDPFAPPSLTVNCRCVLEITLADLTAGAEMTKPALADTLPATEPVFTTLPDGWRGCLAPLNRRTADGRMLVAPQTPRGRMLPMELRAVMDATGGHDGATMIGRMDSVWLDPSCAASDGACLHAEGPFDLGGPNGSEWARRMGDGFASQVSVDPVDFTVEYRYLLADGTEAPEPTSFEEYQALMAGGGEEVAVFTDWALGAATLVGIPALSAARLNPVWGYAPEHGDAAYTVMVDPPGDALLAALGSVLDRADFFAPESDAPQPLTIHADGQLTGHLAQWNTCHLGLGAVCTVAPKGDDFALFHSGAVQVRDPGDGHLVDLPIGKLTLGGGHAGGRLGVVPAVEHYDNTCTTVAVVRASEGRHGIWVSGRLLPNLSRDTIDALRRSPLSGDWRRYQGRLRLVAALAVNTPGFPVPRALAASAGDDQVSLVAAGSLLPWSARVPAPGVPTAAEIAREVIRQTKAQAKADALAIQLEARVAPVLRQTQDERVAALAARVNQED